MWSRAVAYCFLIPPREFLVTPHGGAFSLLARSASCHVSRLLKRVEVALYIHVVFKLYMVYVQKYKAAKSRHRVYLAHALDYGYMNIPDLPDPPILCQFSRPCPFSDVQFNFWWIWNDFNCFAAVRLNLFTFCLLMFEFKQVCNHLHLEIQVLTAHKLAVMGFLNQPSILRRAKPCFYSEGVEWFLSTNIKSVSHNVLWLIFAFLKSFIF